KAMKASRAAPEIATRENGNDGLTAQTKNAAIPSATRLNPIPELAMLKPSSASTNAKTIAASPGSHIHTADLPNDCHQRGRNFSIAAKLTPRISASSRE